MAIRRNPGFDVFNVRLLVGLDKLLREKRRYQGDLSASINDALLAVNLNTVNLVTLKGKKKQTARETQVVLLRRLIRKLHYVAEARGCSINQLVNSGLEAYYSNEHVEKRGASSRPTRAAASSSYDKMSSEERQQLVEELAGLAGLQEGPKDAFPDGTRYEYDSRFKTTFEITPSGKRFPVELVAGKFQRRSAKLEHTKAYGKDVLLNEPKPLLVVIVGPMGAGKTTFYDAHLKEAFPVLVPPVPHQREAMFREHRSFAIEELVVDTQLLESARDAGYATKVIFILTEDPKLNVGRILIRMIRGGQSVPLNTIPESYEQSMKSLWEARKHADDLLVYDNTPDGKGHRLVARFIAGELVKTTHAPPQWFKSVISRQLRRPSKKSASSR